MKQIAGAGPRAIREQLLKNSYNMNFTSETAVADELLASAALSSSQCDAPQRYQIIKRKSRASPETDNKKSKSNIGKQGKNSSSTQPSYGDNSNRFSLLPQLSVDKEVGNDIGDLYDKLSTSHQAAIAADKRDATSAGITSSPIKAQSKPSPIVMEGVDNVCRASKKSWILTRLRLGRQWAVS